MAQATLNGQLVDDGGSLCDVWFEWGTDTSYGMVTPLQGGLASGALFSATITGLAEGMVYHFRAVVANRQGISYGNDMAFATLAAQGIAVLIDDAALVRFLEVV